MRQPHRLRAAGAGLPCPRSSRTWAAPTRADVAAPVSLMTSASVWMASAVNWRARSLTDLSCLGLPPGFPDWPGCHGMRPVGIALMVAGGLSWHYGTGCDTLWHHIGATWHFWHRPRFDRFACLLAPEVGSPRYARSLPRLLLLIRLSRCLSTLKPLSGLAPCADTMSRETCPLAHGVYGGPLNLVSDANPSRLA